MYSQAPDNVSKLLGTIPKLTVNVTAVLFADLVADDSDDLVPVADNRLALS